MKQLIKEAEGQAEAILKVQQANADGLRFLKEAGAGCGSASASRVWKHLQRLQTAKLQRLLSHQRFRVWQGLPNLW